MNFKKEPWRLVVGIIAILFIVFMWIKNDVIEIYTSAPKETVLPMVVTTVVVALLKVALISGVILLIKWIVEKVKNNKENQKK